MTVRYNGQVNMIIRGYLEVVRLLMKDPRVDPSFGNNNCIRSASYHGRLKVARLLLSDSRVDPYDVNNDAIRTASAKRHFEVVRLLVAHPQVLRTCPLSYLNDCKDDIPLSVASFVLLPASYTKSTESKRDCSGSPSLSSLPSSPLPFSPLFSPLPSSPLPSSPLSPFPTRRADVPIEVVYYLTERLRTFWLLSHRRLLPKVLRMLIQSYLWYDFGVGRNRPTCRFPKS